MAAALLRRRVEHLPETVGVSSAGLLESGLSVPPEVVTVMADYGIDLARHHSTRLSADAIAEADLVLAMARRHAREIVLLDPEAWYRTFMLKEFVRRGEQLGPRHPREGVGQWLDHVQRGRDRASMVGASTEDDIVDPLGGPLLGYQASARDLDNLVDRMVTLLWPTRRSN